MIPRLQLGSNLSPRGIAARQVRHARLRILRFQTSFVCWMTDGSLSG
jgi:hypothetical protein